MKKITILSTIVLISLGCSTIKEAPSSEKSNASTENAIKANQEKATMQKEVQDKITYRGKVYLNDNDCIAVLKTEDGNTYNEFCVNSLGEEFQEQGIWVSFQVVNKLGKKPNSKGFGEVIIVDVESVKRIDTPTISFQK